MEALRASPIERVTPQPPSGGWHTLSREEVERRLDTSGHGLTQKEARLRLERRGPNELPEPPATSPLRLLLHQFQSPLIYILLLAALVTLLLQEYIDAGVIAVVLALNAAIGFTQEGRAEQSVRALRKLLAPHARVIREGREWDVESRVLVPGDLVLLESGTRVPADLRLVYATALQVDESLLTGESLASRKSAAELREDLPLADRTNMAYAATVVTSGRAHGYVVGTGAETELGAIAAQVRGTGETETPLQHRMSRFARIVGVVVAIAASLAFAIGVGRGESPGEMFMVAVTLAVSAVPEGLPVAFTIALAVGVRRMAQRRALIRRLPAVETLGSTTTIGSDKTGTLTENRMTVQEIWADGKLFTLHGEPGVRQEAFHDGLVSEPAQEPSLYLTLLAGVLANEAQVYRSEAAFDWQGDPTEVALLLAAQGLGIEPSLIREVHPLYAQIPFESERLYAASLCDGPDGREFFLKGAPERVIDMCTTMQSRSGPSSLDRQAIRQAAAAMAARGLRVLAMAYGPSLEDDSASADPENLRFLGLQGMLDPPRAGVREAISDCRQAGVRVVMITGDHADTAAAIAADLGISEPGSAVLTGSDLDRLDDSELARLAAEVPVYARVAPEHKLRVVRALQANGEVVAVTGDGVNDAPALKAAEIGIAMGRSGTDVAREAADMVLADDNFVSITAAVEEGRVTFANLRKVTFFLISTGAAEIVAVLTALVLGSPLPFLPAQILWLNLVTNGLQDVALAFEPGEKGVLQRPPRPRSEGIISALLWERTLITGLVMAAGTLGLFWWELEASGSLVRAQTVALTTMVLFQVFHVGNVRSEDRSLLSVSPFSNRFLFIATASALTAHVVALYFPPMQAVLRVEPVELEAWGRMLLVASTILPVIELHKLLRRRPPLHAQLSPRTSEGSAR